MLLGAQQSLRNSPPTVVSLLYSVQAVTTVLLIMKRRISDMPTDVDINIHQLLSSKGETSNCSFHLILALPFPEYLRPTILDKHNETFNRIDSRQCATGNQRVSS